MKATITFEVIKPDDVSDSDFKAWINFEIGINNELWMSNKLEYAEIRDLAKNHRVVFKG